MKPVDKQAIMSGTGHSERTIRNHCRVIGYDHQGRALYDPRECLQALDEIPTRRREPVAA